VRGDLWHFHAHVDAWGFQEDEQTIRVGLELGWSVKDYVSRWGGDGQRLRVSNGV
jgi:hypothetical protein